MPTTRAVSIGTLSTSPWNTPLGFSHFSVSHRECREAEKHLHLASMICKKLLGAVKANETLLCDRESLTAHCSDLVSLCESTMSKPWDVVGRHVENLQHKAHSMEGFWNVSRGEAGCPNARGCVPHLA